LRIFFKPKQNALFILLYQSCDKARLKSEPYGVTHLREHVSKDFHILVILLLFELPHDLCAQLKDCYELIGQKICLRFDFWQLFDDLSHYLGEILRNCKVNLSKHLVLLGDKQQVMLGFNERFVKLFQGVVNLL
jgi:hypothetical protein